MTSSKLRKQFALPRHPSSPNTTVALEKAYGFAHPPAGLSSPQPRQDSDWSDIAANRDVIYCQSFRFGRGEAIRGSFARWSREALSHAGVVLSFVSKHTLVLSLAAFEGLAACSIAQDVVEAGARAGADDQALQRVSNAPIGAWRGRVF